jgi:tetratricopeptide (TPR) repeat protein
MAQINFVVRQLIRLVYGASLAPGTFADALTEYQTAVALNPTKLIHRVELGRTYLRLGRKAEALRELQASVALDVEDVNASLQKDDAELLLRGLGREFARSVVPLDAGEEAVGGGRGDAGQAPPVAGGAGAA